MNAARLERLAHLCQLEHNEYAESRETYFDHGDLLDLARCARGWAKVEARCCSLGPLLIKSAWQHVDHDGRVRYGCTALEAVEAAEVKP